MQEQVSFFEEDGSLTARLLCEIDHHTAKPTREKIDREIFRSKPHTVILDFSNVHFMDSSGIGLIRGRCEVASELCARVRITGMSEALLKLVRLSGIEKIGNLSIK